MVATDPTHVPQEVALSIQDGGRLAGPRERAEFVCEIIEHRRLTPLFQPLVDLHNGRIVGFEGLLRGPSDSPLHAPVRLLRAARQAGLGYEMERLGRQITAERFAELRLPGRLHINVSPDMLVLDSLRQRGAGSLLQGLPLAPERVVLELAEADHAAGYDLQALIRAVEHCRSHGFRVAIDDLGEGAADLRLWSELRPHQVKTDPHFIQNIDKDPVKSQFLRSMLEIADSMGCELIVEGIESHKELVVAKSLGVPLGQGNYIARATPTPTPILRAEVAKVLLRGWRAGAGGAEFADPHAVIENKLLLRLPAVSPRTANEHVFAMFETNPGLESVAVVDNAVPVGMISRHVLVDKLARPYHHELYGRKPCSMFMDPEPLVVDKNHTIQELSYIVVASDRRHLTNGFIVTEQEKYIGIGTGHDLMREITDMQLRAARYANPLTQLPGNVPINERIDVLLNSGESFVACYCDLDHFKPFNDVYGFSKGDAVIQLTGKVLEDVCDPELDFIGHIGGDDFIVLFCSPDWETRCHEALDIFAATIQRFFNPADRGRGGYVTENRRGEKEFHPLTTLSIGAVVVEPAVFGSYMEISRVAAESKKKAKRLPGNTLHVNSRDYAQRDERPPLPEATIGLRDPTTVPRMDPARSPA